MLRMALMRASISRFEWEDLDDPAQRIAKFMVFYGFFVKRTGIRRPSFPRICAIPRFHQPGPPGGVGAYSKGALLRRPIWRQPCIPGT